MDHDEILELSGENNANIPDAVSRRGFFRLGAAGAASAAGLALAGSLRGQDKPAEHKPPAQPPADIKTNVDEIKAIPRTKDSMPGKFPGRVVKIDTGKIAAEGKIDAARVKTAVERGMAEPNGFPYLRDKVVLNIVDGLQAQYDKGPGANPQFVYDANLMMFGSDPVAVDAVAHEYLVKVRIERGVQEFDNARNREYLDLAAGLGLGVSQRDKIALKEIALG